jgi:hypothetical protein
MDFRQLFLARHSVLYDFWLGGLWTLVPEEMLRRRPHPRVNPIAWVLWHVARVEDAALNRFIDDRTQVLDEGQWPERLQIPWRHNGSGMTYAQVDDLSQAVNLPALQGYSSAVAARTGEIVNQLDLDRLDDVLPVEHLRAVLFDEGLAGAGEAEGLLENYTGWTKGRCLMNLGLTHAFHHVGEIGVIASLHGLDL